MNPNMPSSGRVDVVAVMRYLHDLANTTRDFSAADQRESHEARAAVAELIESVSEVYGAEENAGKGTCIPGCMSCRIQRALAGVQGGAP